MNLRQLDKADLSVGDPETRRFSHFSAPNFRVQTSIIGNMGEPLEHRQVSTSEAAELYNEGHDYEENLGQ